VGADTDVALQVEVPDIGAFAEGVPGAATLEGQVTQYAPGGYAVDLVADLPFDATARLEGRVGASRSALSYRATIPDLGAVSPAIAGPAIAEGRIVQLPSGRIEVTADAEGPYDATADVNALLGAGRDGTGRLEAEAAVRLPDLGAVVPGVSGPLRADATVDQREDGAFAIALDASGPYAADFAAEAVLGGPDPARATAEVSVPNLAPLVPALQGPLEAEIAAEQQADGAWEVDVDADGPFASTLAAEAALGPGGGPVDATLSLRVPNVAPIVPRFPGALTVDATVRQSAGAPLQVQANVSGPLGLTADAEGRIGEGEGRVRFDAAVPDIAPIAPGLSGALSVRGSATQRQDAWAVDLQTSGPGAASTRVAGTVDPGGTADLSITGSAPLGLLNGLLAPQRLDGDVTADLRLNGPLGLDSLSGTLSTQGTRLAIPAINQAIENIDLTATLGGGQIALQGSAASAAGGGLSLSGPITLAPGFPADLAIDFDQMVVEDPALFRTELGGTLTVTGPLQGTGGVIGGRVTATPTELRIPSGSVGFSGNIPRVQHVNEPAGVRLTRQRAGLVNERREARGGAPGRTVFGLDLTIDAPNRVFLRGRGLDVELGGSFRIGGTTRNPAPVGGIEVIRGRLDILGRRLELEDDGQIVLGGNLVPFLELTATSDDLDDFTIVISIEGPVDSPEFTFSSNPPLPQDEVLARFFFGRGLADLSPLQAAQLAASIARLTGRGGDGLLSGLREGLGVDDFNLVTDDEGDAALQIGTYLSENIYTDVTTSTGGQTEVNLNIDVTDNVTVQGSADNEGETSLGIFFQRDY
jgi:translocation and assembly module TamB